MKAFQGLFPARNRAAARNALRLPISRHVTSAATSAEWKPASSPVCNFFLLFPIMLGFNLLLQLPDVGHRRRKQGFFSRPVSRYDPSESNSLSDKPARWTNIQPTSVLWRVGDKEFKKTPDYPLLPIFQLRLGLLGALQGSRHPCSYTQKPVKRK